MITKEFSFFSFVHNFFCCFFLSIPSKNIFPFRLSVHIYHDDDDDDEHNITNECPYSATVERELNL